MYKIGAIGEKDEVYAFLAVGVDISPVNTSKEAINSINSMSKEDYALIFITETLAKYKDVKETIDRYKNKLLPAIILIPGKEGSLGIALDEVKDNVEKAIGIDILSKKEG